MQTTVVWRPRGLPDLNFDILLQIISLLTPRDIAYLTRTCHALRRALSAELPREGVTLEGRHLTSFLAFTDVKHGKDRLSYLQELTLPGSTYETISSGDQAMSLKDVKRALSTILLAASSLRSLFILELDTFSFPPKELKALLDSLPHLRELEMSGVQKKYEGVLVDVLPRLRILGLDFLEEGDPSTFLKARQCDLHEVTLNGAMLRGVSLSFPTVQILHACPANLPSDVDALTRMFPNVRDVTLHFPHDCGRLDLEFRKDLPRYHLGVASQAWTNAYAAGSWRGRLLARPQRKADAWPHLQSLRASGVAMERMGWLGLACHVPRFEVCSWRSTMRFNQLVGMLEELRPRCLVLHPGVVHRRWGNRLLGWLILWALQSAPYVTRLTVVLCEDAMDVISEGPHWLGTFCTCLEQSCVSFLLLRLHFDRGVSTDLSNTLQTWRAAMSEKVPSLQVFLFQIEDHVHLGWTKKPEGWVEMTEDETRKLVESEKMCPASIETCDSCEGYLA